MGIFRYNFALIRLFSTGLFRVLYIVSKREVTPYEELEVHDPEEKKTMWEEEA